MNLYQIISYPLFAGGILQVILGIALLKQAPRKSRAMNACAALFFSAAVFTLFTAISYTLESHGRSYNFFNRASWLGWFMIPAGLQFAYYMQDENSRAARIVGYVLYPFWGLVFALTMFTDLVEPGDPSLVPFVDIDGPLEKPLRVIGSLLAIWLLAELYRAKNRMSGSKKAQFNLFFYGTLFFNVGCILVAGVLPLFGAINPAFTTFVSLPWVVITYYAVTRQRLFDLRLFISRALNIFVLSVFFSVLHLCLFELLTTSLGDEFAILLSLSILGLIFFGTQFNRAVKQWIQRMVLGDKYDYQAVLKETIKAIVTILNQDELLAYLIHSIKKSLGVESICLSLMMRGGRLSQLYGDGVLKKSKQDHPLSDGMIEWLRHANHIVVREELEIGKPQYESRTMYEYMTVLGAELIMPLVYKADIRGVIVLGPKGSGETYVQSDIDLLESLAGHAAIAIENAQLYDEARQAKDSERETESKFRTLAETAAIAIFIHQGGNFLYANPAAELIGGYAVNEYLSMNFLSLVHPDYLDMIKARARERLVGGEAPPQYEFKIVRKDRGERWVLMTAGTMEYEGKSAVIGTLIDISARKQAEEETERLFNQLAKTTISLKESEAKFRALAETTTAAIFIHQGQKLVYANTAGQIMSGYNREELLHEDFWALIHPDHKDLVRERGQARMQDGRGSQEYEFKFIRKNGEERWATTTAGIIEYGGKPAIIATLFDITDWKLAEEAKIKFYEESVRQYQDRIEEEKRHRLEKEKILMDLHDGIGGITTNISILSELAQKSTDSETVRKTLSTISKLSREGMSEIRSFMHSLDSKELNWRTLAVELRNQGINMVEPHKIKFTLETAIEDMQEQPGSLIWANMFKIYKESLTNVIKHSKATSVNVVFRAGPDGVFLTIEDNGVGTHGGRVGGRGLSNMKSRAGDIGGTLTILADRGTRVRVELPLPLKYPAQGMAL